MASGPLTRPGGRLDGLSHQGRGEVFFESEIPFGNH
jgi:hypothetical protein